MKLIIDIPESEYQTYLVAHISGMGNSAMERIIDGKLLKDELQEIRDEMNILDDKEEFNISSALKILDKHIKEIEESDTE